MALENEGREEAQQVGDHVRFEVLPEDLPPISDPGSLLGRPDRIERNQEIQSADEEGQDIDGCQQN